MRKSVAAVLDLCGVLVFVGIGRASHQEATSLGGFFTTAWPFLVALAVGWVVTRAWRREPAALLPVGVGVWATTVVLGMALRVVSGQGTAGAFVVVTCLFLALMLLGWRAVARGVGRLARRPGTS